MTVCIPLWALLTVAGIVLVKWAVEAYLAVRVFRLLKSQQGGPYAY